MRFEVLLNVVATGFAVFWDVTPCGLLETYVSKGTCGLLHQDKKDISLMMEALRPSEASVNLYQITQCHVQEDSSLPPLF